jgi:hypothetical protein
MFDRSEELASDVADTAADRVVGAAAASAHPGPGESAVGPWSDEVVAIAGLEWSAMAVTERVDAVRQLSRVWRAASAAVAAGLASLDGIDLPDHAEGLSAGGWWSHDTSSCGREGMWLVRAGDLMEDFPHLGAAVRAGSLSLEHLRALDAITDEAVLEELIPLDSELRDAARRMSMSTWRREVRARVAIARALCRRRAAQRQVDDEASEQDAPGIEPPGAEGSGGPGSGGPEPGSATNGSSGTPTDPATGASDEELFPGSGATGPEGGGADVGGPPASAPLREESSWLSARPTVNGGLRISGELFGGEAELVRQAMERETSRQRRVAWREHEESGVELPPVGELRARALAELVRRGHGTECGDTVGPRTDAVVVIPLVDDEACARVRALDGEPLPMEVAEMLACDAHLQALLVDRRGQPLWLGRSTRLATAAQRRVLALRDGGCVFPGCDMPPQWCDVHHAPSWERGGATDLDAMVMLCRRHHGAAHSSRWLLRRSSSSDPGPPDAGLPGRDSKEPERCVRAPSGEPPGPAPGVQPGPVGAVEQQFEWFDRRTGRVAPAHQRGVR